jgi:hypothetical protein
MTDVVGINPCTLIAENVLNGTLDGDSQHMMAVPKRIEDHTPSRLVVLQRIRNRAKNIFPSEDFSNSRL